MGNFFHPPPALESELTIYEEIMECDRVSREIHSQLIFFKKPYNPKISPVPDVHDEEYFRRKEEIRKRNAAKMEAWRRERKNHWC